MPLISPEIQAVLREAGLLESAGDKNKKDSRPLSEKLDAAGLGLDETLEELAIVVKGTGNESLRVRCLETVLKAHGALKETPTASPSFTIVINGAPPLNPNLQIPTGVNPILLPRQLLGTLKAN